MTVDRQKTAKSALWSLVENGGLSLISVAALIIYTRLLSATEFGLFATALALVEMLQVIVTMLFHDALVQRKDVRELHYDTAFTFGMGLSLVLTALTTLGAGLLSRAVGEPGAAPVLGALSLCFPAAALSATIVARQRREFGFRALAVRSLLGRLTGAVIGVGLIIAGAGIWGLIAQQVLIQAVGSAFLWKTCEQRPRLRFGGAELRELVGFGAFSMGSLFLSFGVKRLFTVAVGVLLGLPLAGVLNLAFRTVDVLWAIASTAATQVALPLLSSLQHDVERLKRAFRVAMGLVCTILYSSFIGIGAVAPEVVEALFGAKWLAAAPYVTALSWLVVLQAPRVLMGPLLTALGRPKDLVVSRTVELGFVALAVLVTQLPSLGWAVAIWIVRELVGTPVNVRHLQRAAGFSVLEQFRGAFAPLLAATFMALVLAGARFALPLDWGAWPRLLVLIPLGALSFVAFSFFANRELLTTLLDLARAAIGKATPGPRLSPGAALSGVQAP